MSHSQKEGSAKMTGSLWDKPVFNSEVIVFSWYLLHHLFFHGRLLLAHFSLLQSLLPFLPFIPVWSSWVINCRTRKSSTVRFGANLLQVVFFVLYKFKSIFFRVGEMAHWLKALRAQVQFPAPTQKLTKLCNSCFMGSDTLTDIHAVKPSLYIR